MADEAKAIFPWTNDQWASANAPWLRMAAVVITRLSDDELDKSMVNMGEVAGVALVDGIGETAMHLQRMEGLCWAALQRLEAAAGRVGV